MCENGHDSWSKDVREILSSLDLLHIYYSKHNGNIQYICTNRTEYDANIWKTDFLPIPNFVLLKQIFTQVG